MRLDRSTILRAAVLLPPLLLPPGARKTVAAGASELTDRRITAQTVGIDSPSIGGIIWGARERCDPTQPGCAAGRETDEVISLPPPRTPYDVTDRIRLDLSIQGKPAGSILLGLWRNEAPVSVDTLVRLAAGTFTSRPGEEPASLSKSGLVRVDRDRSVVLGSLSKIGGSTVLVPGQTRPQRVPVQPPSHSDSNAMRHDAAGLVSVKRGGESFLFTLTPRPNKALDRDEVVIGQVMDAAGMEVLERLNNLATNNYNKGALVIVKVDRAQVVQ